MKKVTIKALPRLKHNAKESLNTLCTNISLSSDSIRKIVVTSCRPKEGKSFITINLMRALSSIGKKVVMVDADLRVSMLASRYGIQPEEPKKFIGLAQYLYKDYPIDEIIYKTNYSCADFIPAGGRTINSLPLLNNPRLKELLDTLAEKYDIVLVDAPPIGVIIDAAEIAKDCDGILMVVENNKIGCSELKTAMGQLSMTGCEILGAVLNKVSFKTKSAKKYYYRTYYSHYNSYSSYYHRPNWPNLKGTKLKNADRKKGK